MAFIARQLSQLTVNHQKKVLVSGKRVYPYWWTDRDAVWMIVVKREGKGVGRIYYCLTIRRHTRRVGLHV